MSPFYSQSCRDLLNGNGTTQSLGLITGAFRDLTERIGVHAIWPGLPDAPAWFDRYRPPRALPLTAKPVVQRIIQLVARAVRRRQKRRAFVQALRST